jgi:hypothetical protein
MEIDAEKVLASQDSDKVREELRQMLSQALE